MTGVSLGFLPKPISVPLANLLPSRLSPPNLATSQKYKQIRASIEEIGMIEPLSVGPVDRHTGRHIVLDGHTRLLILRELSHAEAPCLVAIDDESYTYNNRVNGLSTVQEHMMIRRAIDRGLPPDRLALALHLDPIRITRKLNQLDGICPEAIDLLKDQQFSTEVFVALRRMKPTRQAECAELMVSANNVSVVYARALLSGTPPERLVAPKNVRIKGVSQEQLGRMQKEMTGLHDQYKIAEQTYAEDTLDLVLARGYLTKLLDNELVFRYLEKHHPEVLEQFVSIGRSNGSDA